MDHDDFESGEIMKPEEKVWGLKSQKTMNWNDDGCGTWNLQVLQNIARGKKMKKWRWQVQAGVP